MKLSAGCAMTEDVEHTGESSVVGQQPPQGEGDGEQGNTDGGWLHQEQSGQAGGWMPVPVIPE